MLIVGCGYVGLPLGAELVRRGHAVWGMRRSEDGAGDLRAAGVTPVFGDVTRLESLRALPGPFDWVVNTVSSSKGGADVYRAVYLEGTRNLLAWLAGGAVRRFVHTSSTSVYGQTDGGEVTEESAAEPRAETGRLLVETENLLLAAASERDFPAVVLRVAGIYGPERGHLFQQYLRDEAHISGDGSRLLNMIHRDDVVGAAIAALEPPTTLTQMRSFIGMATYYCKFLADYNLIKKPLTNLTKKGEAWRWGPEQQSSFEGIKALLISAPVLRHPDWT